MNFKKKISVFSLTILFMMFLSGCQEKQPVQKSEILMSTHFSIVVYDRKKTTVVRKTVREVFSYLRKMEEKYSIHYPDSFFSVLNDKKKISADSNDLLLIKRMKSYSVMTGGAFDFTVKPWVELWGIYHGQYRLPEPEEIDRLKKKTGFSNLLISGSDIILINDASVDPGGVLKGTAVDRAFSLLTNKRIETFLINAGGNIRASGSKPGGDPWRIGIRHPRNQNEYFEIIEIEGGFSIATSGDYERFFITNGIRYHHLLDSRTGYPVQNGLVSVSVMTDSAEKADMFSTALFIMGLEKGLKFAETHHLAALFINDQMEKTESREWKKKVIGSIE